MSPSPAPGLSPTHLPAPPGVDMGPGPLNRTPAETGRPSELSSSRGTGWQSRGVPHLLGARASKLEGRSPSFPPKRVGGGGALGSRPQRPPLLCVPTPGVPVAGGTALWPSLHPLTLGHGCHEPLGPPCGRHTPLPDPGEKATAPGKLWASRRRDKPPPPPPGRAQLPGPHPGAPSR